MTFNMQVTITQAYFPEIIGTSYGPPTGRCDFAVNAIANEEHSATVSEGTPSVGDWLSLWDDYGAIRGPNGEVLEMQDIELTAP